MIQIATFLVPQQQNAANEFLKTHKPDGQVNFNKDTVVIFWDDGTYPPEHQIADLQDLLQSNRQARFQQEVALHVMKAELADTPTNMARYDELSRGIAGLEAGLSVQELKAAFVEEKIKQLKS